jgi:hypothetical protein
MVRFLKVRCEVVAWDVLEEESRSASVGAGAVVDLSKAPMAEMRVFDSRICQCQVSRSKRSNSIRCGHPALTDRPWSGNFPESVGRIGGGNAGMSLGRGVSPVPGEPGERARAGKEFVSLFCKAPCLRITAGSPNRFWLKSGKLYYSFDFTMPDCSYRVLPSASASIRCLAASSPSPITISSLFQSTLNVCWLSGFSLCALRKRSL